MWPAGLTLRNPAAECSVLRSPGPGVGVSKALDTRRSGASGAAQPVLVGRAVFVLVTAVDPLADCLTTLDGMVADRADLPDPTLEFVPVRVDHRICVILASR